MAKDVLGVPVEQYVEPSIERGLFSKQALFKSIPVFNGFSKQQINQLLTRTLEIDLNESDMLFTSGSKADNFYIVVSGANKLYRLSSNGNEKVIDIANPGDVIGLPSLFLQEPSYSYWCQSVTDTQLLAIDRKCFLKTIADSPDILIKLLGELSCQVQNKIDEIDSICLKSAGTRFADYLVANISEVNDTKAVHLRANKNTLASKLSITPETLSRLIRTFKQKNILGCQGNHHFLIHDIETLQNMSSQGCQLKYY
ncbi:MAG: Crp/Fnr family transcriptional regulator [Candidatus Sedimenticola sp. (ex Thyasira tokunagai)]